jgi:F0F1-type ATP synthase membrane subunit b/b'
MPLILYATIIISTLCSISEAGWFFSKDVSENVAKEAVVLAVVGKAHWEATIKSMDNQIAEVSARRDAADLETSAESDDVEDECDAELIRLRKRKREIAKAFTAWKNPTESIDTKMAEVRARRKVAELDDTSTENDAVLEQCHAELGSLKKEKLTINTMDIPAEVKEVAVAAHERDNLAKEMNLSLNEVDNIAKEMNLSLNEIVSF